MKLGKIKSAKPVTFKLSKYINKAALPPLPKTFGHENLVKAWHMLANDKFGNCVWAGAAHETMLWTREGDIADANFSDAAVLSDYAAVTGFDPHKPDTDRGTDMQQAASYRRTTGIIDSRGKRHKVAAYLAIEPGNLHEHYLGVYLFGAVGIGFNFPVTAMDQFNAHKPWDVVHGAKIDGGHYVPLVANRDNIECVTWGRLQGMTVNFLGKYNDESLAYVSEDALTARKSLEGFDYDTLLADLAALKRA